MIGPTCRKCGRKLTKLTRSHWLRSQAQADRGIGGRDWITVPHLPKTREEAQHLSNHPVVNVWHEPAGRPDAGISRFTTWEGEYYVRYGHFCTVNCAARFGQIMADGEL